MIARAAERALTEHGPMRVDDLRGALERAGVELGDDPSGTLSAVLENVDLLVPLTDGRWAWLPALLGGRIFTHRVSARELEHDVLTITPDLVAVTAFVKSSQQSLAAVVLPCGEGFDAGPLIEREIPFDAVDGHGALLLPRGRLAEMGLTAGDLIGLRLAPTGPRWEKVEEHELTPESADLGRQLGEILAHEPDEPRQLGSVVWTACAADPALFRQASPPVGQSLLECGLPYEGDLLAGAGFDFDQWWARRRIKSIAERHGLDHEEAVAVHSAITIFDHIANLYAGTRDADAASGYAATMAKSDPAQLRKTLEFLSEAAITRAVADESGSVDGLGAVALGLFAESLEPWAPPTTRVALRWLRAKAYERLGDIAEAEAAYRAAATLDPSWPLTLLDLAHYASDRGDAREGLSLLRRAGVPPEYGLAQLLERYQLPTEQLPLSERSHWLYQKAEMFVLEGRWRDALCDAAGGRSRLAESPEAFSAAFHDPLVMDAVLFEGGAFADFVAVRGALLPDDEHLLAEQWLLTTRSVFEVQDVRAGEGISVRDVRTGEVHDVREPVASLALKTGALICARIMFAGDTMQIFGAAVKVPIHVRDNLMALLDTGPGPIELIAFMTQREYVSVVQNTEGERIVVCNVTLRVPDPAAMMDALDTAYEREEDDPEDDSPSWVDFVTTNGLEHLRANLLLSGDELHIHANSTTRIDRVLATVRELEPSVTVVSELRQPARDEREARKLIAASPANRGQDGAPDPNDPEVAAMMSKVMREYERRWLDTPIPALAGRTPRECADDPTRRPDLIRILDSIPPDNGQFGAVSPDRLRAALNLTATDAGRPYER